MCYGNTKCGECNKRAAENFGGSAVSGPTIGQTFQQNKEAIAAIFEKHGIEAEPTPANAGEAFKQKGPAFARDMATVLFPEHVSYFDQDKTAEAIGITSSILTGLGAAGQGIAMNMPRKGGSPVYQQQPDDMRGPDGRHDRRGEVGATLYFGFLKPIHLGLIGMLIVIIGGIVIFGGDSKKPA